MGMPFSEFLSSGDFKFIIFTLVAIIQKLRNGKNSENPQAVAFRNERIGESAFWILIISVLSLLLGLMHGFYIVAQAPGLLF